LAEYVARMGKVRNAYKVWISLNGTKGKGDKLMTEA